MYRQGDILIVPASNDEVSKAAQDGHQIAHERERLILAYGESTGHTHAILEAPIEMFEVDNGKIAGQFIRAAVPFAVVHEEHAPLKLPVGNFRIIRQREYTPATQGRQSTTNFILD